MNVDAYHQIVFARTDKGAEEIEKRTCHVPIRLRTLLLLINGSDPVARILEKAAGIGNGMQMLEELRTQGFIRDVDDGAAAPVRSAPATDTRFRGVVLATTTWIHDTLGPDGDQIAEKLENIRTPAELQQYLHSHRELLEMAAGKRRCEDFFQRVAGALDRNKPAPAA
jgi:hypothetical protein